MVGGRPMDTIPEAIATLIERLPDDTLESFLEASKTDSALVMCSDWGSLSVPPSKGMPLVSTRARSLVMLLDSMDFLFSWSLDVRPLGVA